MRRLSSRSLFVMLLLALLALSANSQTSSDEELENAIRALRNINSAKLTDSEKEAHAKQIDAAWKTIIASGDRGLARLKKEISKTGIGSPDRDDFFRLNAAVLLWEMGKTGEVENIREIWESTPVAAQYNYVFLTAFQAAMSQDPKVLPMLRATLKDDKGSMYVGLHAMNVKWPLSHEFLWGSYGPAGLPVLDQVLNTSKNEIEVKSAIILLAKAQYLPSLPRIRELAKSDNESIRRQAIQALGAYGHPHDYDFLVSGLRSPDTKELWSYVFALYEYDDLRVVPLLMPLLEKGDQNLSVETFVALLHLLTPESFDAAQRFVSSVEDPPLKALLEQRVSFIKQDLPADYSKRTLPEKIKAVAAVRNSRLFLKPGETPLTNQRLIESLNVWKDKGRMQDDVYKRVDQRQLIAAARPENIPAMLETKARFYRRLSDECLYEVRDFDIAIKYIGRSRYRKGIGVTEKAEAN